MSDTAILVRLPRSLHEALKEQALLQGVSLNTLCVEWLAKPLDDLCPGESPVPGLEPGNVDPEARCKYLEQSTGLQLVVNVVGYYVINRDAAGITHKVCVKKERVTEAGQPVISEECEDPFADDEPFAQVLHVATATGRVVQLVRGEEPPWIPASLVPAFKICDNCGAKCVIEAVSCICGSRVFVN